MDPRHLVKCMSTVFNFMRPDTCVGTNGGFKHAASFMEVVLVSASMDDAVAESMLTPKDDQNVPQAATLCHAIATLATEAVTLERPDDKLREGLSGNGDASGDSSGDADLEELLVLTHGAVLNVAKQARFSIGGADVNNVSVCKMIFGYGTVKSNDRLKRVRGIGHDNSRRGDTPAG